MPQNLTVAVAQSRTLDTLSATLQALEGTTRRAAAQNVDLILFPEAYLGGYPRTCTFGASVGGRTDAGREQFRQYFQGAVDLGDTPAGAGAAWVERRLATGIDEGGEGEGEGEGGGATTGARRARRRERGDGTREQLERVARETGVFVVTGVVERSGGTLYCAVVYVCPHRGCVGKRRKVMPTGSERLVWGQGAAASLRAVTATIRGVRVTMAAAICWENMMPLLRYALYSQNVNLWLAPTADARDTWLPLMRTVGNEGRCFVLSAISCVTRKNLPAWIGDDSAGRSAPNAVPAARQTEAFSKAAGRRRSTISVEDRHELVLPAVGEYAGHTAAVSPNTGDSISPVAMVSPSVTNGAVDSRGDEFVCRGGSCITGPMGEVIAGPLWEVEDDGLLVQEVDFDDCDRGRLDLDVAGSYSRNDAFKLTVEGLDLSPPP